MKGTAREVLSRVEELLEKGDYRDALKLVEELLGQEGLSANDRLACSLFESRLRLKLGESERALKLAETTLKGARKEANLLIVVDALIVKAEISWRSGKIDEGLESLAEGEGLLKGIEKEQASEEEVRRRTGEISHHRGVIFWYTGELDQALECHQVSLAISETLDDQYGVAGALNNLGLVFWSKGDYSQAIEYYQRSLAIGEQQGNRRFIATTLNNLGNCYSLIGDFDQALEYHQRSLAIREELELWHDISSSLTNIGVIHQMRGALDKALEYYQRSLAISKEQDSKRDLALALHNLGSAYSLKGELDQALDFFQRSLTFYRELGTRHKTALTLMNIGRILRKKGSQTKALDYFQQSLTIFEDIGNESYTAIVLFELLWIALDSGESSLAEKHLKRMGEISERTEGHGIKQRYRVAQALSLKASTRTRHKMKAVEILEQVVKEEVVDHSITVSAMIHLCDLLVSELKLTGEEELFSEIKSLTSRLLEIAEQQSSHSLLAETYLLQSKLALIELDMGRAKKLLEQAYAIAEGKGLQILAQAVAHERDSLDSQMQKWERIIEQKPSRQDMVDLIGLDGYLELMVQKTVSSIATTEEVAPKGKYKLVHLDLLKGSSSGERSRFRVAIAQIGVSKDGDILHEFYEPQTQDLFRIKGDKVESVRARIREMVTQAHSEQIRILLFPEMTIDLGYKQLREDLLAYAKTYKMIIIPGSYHDPKTRRNLSLVISPEGVLWEQEKHIPAIISYGGERITEGIDVAASPQKVMIGDTEFGRIAITICRDFLDMDLRVELKNSDPPVDLVFNPAFTPVTAAFRAAHFDARRTIYAYCFFANVGEFGDSFIFSPEKDRVERTIPPKEEKLIYKEIDLFRLRSERKKWEIERRKRKPFIQSTR